MRKKRSLLAGLAATAALATVPWLTAPADAGAAQDRSDGKAAAVAEFGDEFDGAAGDPVDSSKWRLDPGDNESNHELQYYTDGTSNARLDGDGHLVVTAKREANGEQCWYGPCEYTSARMNTAQTFTTTYGHAEISAKITRGQGMWPAFWMLGTDIGDVGWPACGEIDVMENVGNEPDTVHGTVHGPGYSGGEGVGAGYRLPDGGDFADDFHTYAVDWSPNKITWSVDGEEYQTLTPEDVGGEWVFDHDFYLILNVAVGGDWPGSPDEGTEFPQEMVVDHVRVTGGE